MSQFRSTSLRNSTTLYRIHKAMEEAVVKSKVWWGGKGWAYVANRRGRRFMRVDHDRGQPGAFRFWYQDQSDVTPLVLAELRRSVKAHRT